MKAKKQTRIYPHRKHQSKDARELSGIFKNIQDYYETQGKEIINFTDLPLSLAFYYRVLALISRYYKTPRDEPLTFDQKRYLDDIFSGMRSSSASYRVSLNVIRHISQELGISMQIILYGTEDKKKIAEYNYKNFDTMGKLHRKYLSSQFQKNDTLSSVLRKKVLPIYTIREAAEAAGVSYEMIRVYTKKDTEEDRKEGKYKSVPRKVHVLEALSKLAGVDTVDLFIFPVEHVKDSDFLKEKTKG